MKIKFTPEYLLSLTGRVPLIERLNRKSVIMESGCHEYTGNTDRCGYGRIHVGKHQLGAHKVMYLLSVGDYDQSKYELMHTCDNPSCINPEHLVVGTHLENMHDCLRKGRHTSQNYVTSRRRGESDSESASRLSEERSRQSLAYLFSARKLAIANSEKTYVGCICDRHKMSWRKTNNGACIYCMEEYRLSKKKFRSESEVVKAESMACLGGSERREVA